jgi:hypothetical protein
MPARGAVPTGPLLAGGLRTPQPGRSAPLPGDLGLRREERAPAYSGNLDQRLQQLLFWIGRQTGAEVLFVADDGGLPLLTIGAASELVTASAVLSAAYSELWPLEDERHPAFTCLLFEGSRTLTLTAVPTLWGHFALGFLRDGFTDPSLLRKIRHELERAFNEKGEIDG